MKNIILFQFHDNNDIIQNRIDILKYFNPSLEIHGLFGGAKSKFSGLKSQLTGLTTLSFLDEKNKETKWKRRDLSLLQWFSNLGNKIDFNLVYSIEYDLLILESLDKIYHTPKNSIALTGLIKIKDIIEDWDWLTESPYKEESFKFLDFMKAKFNISEFYACLGPGYALSKDFLQKYSKVDIPSIAHEELRLPQLAQAFKIQMVDTKFYDNWNNNNPGTELVFNCNKVEIPLKKVLSEYKGGNRKVFHPVYKKLPLSKLKQSSL